MSQKMVIHRLRTIQDPKLNLVLFGNYANMYQLYSIFYHLYTIMYHLAFEKCKINTLLTELCTSEFSQLTA